MRRWASVIVLSTVLVGANAGSAGAELGPRFGLHPHMTSHAFDAPDHIIRGRLGIVNQTDHAELIKCKVVALLDGSGDTHKKGHGGASARVPGGETKRPHFQIEIRDEPHDFDNVPAKLAVHCRKA